MSSSSSSHFSFYTQDATSLFYSHNGFEINSLSVPKTYFSKEFKVTSKGIDNDIFKDVFEEIINTSLSYHSNINSFNNWLINILPAQIKNNKKKRNEYLFYFDDVIYLKPAIPETNGKLPLFPFKARNENLSYYFNVYANSYQRNIMTGETKIVNSYMKIGSIPAMLTSLVCHLSRYSKSDLKMVFEDSMDPFGYFLREGSEKITVFQENLYHDKFLTIFKKDKNTVAPKDAGGVADDDNIKNDGEADGDGEDGGEDEGDSDNDAERIDHDFITGPLNSTLSSIPDEIPKTTSLNMTNVGGVGRNVVSFKNLETMVTLYSIVGTVFLKINSKKNWPSFQLNIFSKGHKGAKPKRYPIIIILDIFLQFLSPELFMYDDVNMGEYKEWKRNIEKEEGDRKHFDFSFENYYTSSEKKLKVPSKARLDGSRSEPLPEEKEKKKGKKNDSSLSSLSQSNIQYLRNEKRRNILQVLDNLIDRFSNSIDDARIIKNSLQPSIIKYFSIESPYKYIINKRTNDYIMIKKIENNLEDDIQTDFDKVISFMNEIFPSSRFGNKPEIFMKMCFQHLACLNGIRSFDDRDSWVNKRIKMTYENFSTIINCCFKYNIEMKKTSSDINTINIIKNIKSKKSIGFYDVEADDDDIINSSLYFFKIKKDEIKNKFDTALGTEGFDDKPESVENLKRKNHISVLQNATKINPNTKKKTRQIAIRFVQPTQLGFVCPYDSPTDQRCGMIKNISCLTSISLNRFLENYLDDVLIPVAEKFIGKDFRTYNYKQHRIHSITLNTEIIGWCNLYTFENVIRKATKTNLNYYDVEIICSPEEKNIQIYTLGGNIIRPLLKVNEQNILLINKYKRKKEKENSLLFSLIQENIIEYLTPSEQSRSTVAQNYSSLLEIINNRNSFPEVYGKFNGRILPLYMELDALSLFSIQGALMPYQNTCQGPRVTYQTKMFAQSIGNFHDFYFANFFTSFKRCESMRPFVDTIYSNPIGFGRNPAGKMMMVAILAFGNNAEDGIVATQDTIQNYRIQKYLTVKFTLENIEGNKDNDFLREYLSPPDKVRDGKPLSEEELKKYSCIGEDGLPIIGSYLKEDYYIISKKKESPENIVDTSEKVKFGQNGIVERVWVFKDTLKDNKNYKLYIKIKLRCNIPLMIGDKLASRYSQKGTITNIRSCTNNLTNAPYNIVNNEKYLFNKEYRAGTSENDVSKTFFEQTYLKTLPIVTKGPFKGMIPDIIINPHGQPTRMTPGMLMEMLASKAFLFTGERIDATAFKTPSIEKIEEWREILRRNGCDPDGFEECEHTLNGVKYRTKIFIAPCFYQNLKSVLVDSFQYRASGKKDMVTGQPNTGRSAGGGMKNGEMEKSALATWGSTSLLLDRFKICSDKHLVEICQVCGNQARINFKTNTVWCDICGNNNKEIGVMNVSYISVVINRILLGLGIQPTVSKSSKYIEGEIDY